MSTIRISFLGAGAMALRQAQALLDAGLSPRAIVAVHDRDRAAARAFADRFGAADASSARAALQAGTHAVVATSAAAHAEEAMAALEMRRGVFVEKPLALTVREGAALTVLAQRLALPLHVGLSERFHPVVRALVDELDGRRADSLHAVRRVPSMRARDCSVAFNLAVHDVDLALLLTRAPLAVDPAATACGSQLASLRLLGDHGAIVRIEAADGAASPVRTLTLTAGARRYEADLLAGTLVCHGAGGARAVPVDGRTSGLAAQAAALLAAWAWAPAQTGGHAAGILPAPATGAEAFRGLALLARAERTGASARARTPENLPPAASFG